MLTNCIEYRKAVWAVKTCISFTCLPRRWRQAVLRRWSSSYWKHAEGSSSGDSRRRQSHRAGVFLHGKTCLHSHLLKLHRNWPLSSIVRSGWSVHTTSQYFCFSIMTIASSVKEVNNDNRMCEQFKHWQWEGSECHCVIWMTIWHTWLYMYSIFLHFTLDWSIKFMKYRGMKKNDTEKFVDNTYTTGVRINTYRRNRRE